MSNFLAVATVTATLRRMLQAVVAADVSGATVTTVRPSGTGAGLPQTGVNAFLYQVLPNPDLRNADLPTRRSDGSAVDRPVAALDLHYLLSFYGDEATLEPQRLLGSVVRTLHARPVLSRKLLRDTLADPAFSFLAGSDLAEQIEVVRFTPLGFSLAELSQLWTGPLQKADYVLSVTYGAALVLLTADEKPTPALPVRERRIFVQPFRQPFLAAALADSGAADPIVLGTTVRLTGQRLRAPMVRVRLAGQVFEPAAATDTEVRFSLDDTALDVASLRAGVQAVQILQPFAAGESPLTSGGTLEGEAGGEGEIQPGRLPPTGKLPQQTELPQPIFETPPAAVPAPPAGIESNVVAFVLRPRLAEVQLDNPVVARDGTVSGTLHLTIEPPLGTRQVAQILLDPAPGAPQTASYALPAPARSKDSAELRVPVASAVSGLYLVRLQVDGAESPLTFDDDPSSSTFGQWTGPVVSFGSLG